MKNLQKYYDKKSLKTCKQLLRLEQYRLKCEDYETTLVVLKYVSNLAFKLSLGKIQISKHCLMDRLTICNLFN